MTDTTNTQEVYGGQTLPDCPELAIFVGRLYQMLGCRLTIDEGHRYAWRPEPACFRLQGESLPQLPGAEPHEQFSGADEWRGAVKLADYWLSRLSAADKHLIFTLLAPVRMQAPSDFDFREHMQ